MPNAGYYDADGRKEFAHYLVCYFVDCPIMWAKKSVDRCQDDPSTFDLVFLDVIQIA